MIEASIIFCLVLLLVSFQFIGKIENTTDNNEKLLEKLKKDRENDVETINANLKNLERLVELNNRNISNIQKQTDRNKNSHTEKRSTLLPSGYSERLELDKLLKQQRQIENGIKVASDNLRKFQRQLELEKTKAKKNG